MAKPRLTYFAGVGGRAEPIRLLLRLAKVDFEDERYPIGDPEYQARKERGEFSPLSESGAGLPIYTVSGKIYYETNAILRMLGARHGFYSTDPETMWEIDMCMEKVERAIGHAGIGPHSRYVLKMDDNAPEDAFKLWEEFASWGEGQLAKHGKAFLAGTDGVTIADLRYIVQFCDSIYNPNSIVEAEMKERVKAVIDTKPTFKHWVEETMAKVLKDVHSEGLLW